jgi:hypothetical protein
MVEHVLRQDVDAVNARNISLHNVKNFTIAIMDRIDADMCKCICSCPVFQIANTLLSISDQLSVIFLGQSTGQTIHQSIVLTVH